MISNVQNGLKSVLRRFFTIRGKKIISIYYYTYLLRTQCQIVKKSFEPVIFLTSIAHRIKNPLRRTSDVRGRGVSGDATMMSRGASYI